MKALLLLRRLERVGLASQVGSLPHLLLREGHHFHRGETSSIDWRVGEGTPPSVATEGGPLTGPADELLILCLLLAGGQVEELAASPPLALPVPGPDPRLILFLLMTYSSGRVPLCVGLPKRQIGQIMFKQFVHW